MSAVKLTTVDVPVDLVKNSCGLAIDHGCSTFKAVYVSKENKEEASKKDSGTSAMSLIVIEGTKFEQGLEHLSKHALINQDVASEAIFTTGLWCTINAKQITETLHVKLENVSEYDVLIKGFLYLTSHLPRSQAFQDQDQTRVPKPYILLDLAKGVIADSNSAMKGADLTALDDPRSVIQSRDTSSKLPVAQAETDLFPCLFVLCGSSSDFVQVNADGTFLLLDASGRCGISFRGLASILTGCQDFYELMNLAEKGNPKNVDVYSDAFDHDAGAVEDMYTKTLAAEASAIYGFGKCVGAKLADFEKEDLARALLDQFVTDIVQTTMTVSSAAGIKRVFMAGNFVSSKLIRQLMMEQMDRRNLYYKFTGKPTIEIDFLKSCAHIGAIGALVANYEKRSAKP